LPLLKFQPSYNLDTPFHVVQTENDFKSIVTSEHIKTETEPESSITTRLTRLSVSFSELQLQNL